MNWLLYAASNRLKNPACLWSNRPSNRTCSRSQPLVRDEELREDLVAAVHHGLPEGLAELGHSVPDHGVPLPTGDVVPQRAHVNAAARHDFGPAANHAANQHAV
eukprot:CAMPEP_0179114384 /NCGR_PEP_ID=MMETSP0796-20121207/53557_1 /TAXON_ID=73915 /ORGANISM="Pyrodinium bahamense, Strain pbaha01" /LENGTH=103 /DNA_ID=CAMNT_0020812603 /DNA_START=242 /DNA_END=553 /DNA_ORIENTATION=-